MPEEEPAPLDVTFGDISTAAYRIRNGVEVTPIRHSIKMSALCGMDITFKNEFMLPTGRYGPRPRCVRERT